MNNRAETLSFARKQLALGCLEEATEALISALCVDPTWARGWLTLGQAQARSLDYDGAAVSFLRASSPSCDDSSDAFRLVAQENLQLCASKFLDNHSLERITAAVSSPLPARDGELLCAGSPAATRLAMEAVRAGWSRATAVCGSKLVATVGAACCNENSLGDACSVVAALSDTDAIGFAGLSYDWGNLLDTASWSRFCEAKARCALSAPVAPACLRVVFLVIDSAALSSCNALPDGVVRAGEHAFPVPAHTAATTFLRRPVQMQAASLRPWRALTAPTTLLTLPLGGVADASPPCGEWVDVPVASAGDAHAFLAWLEWEDAYGRRVSCGPGGGCAGAVQHATFAPPGSPWRVEQGATLRVRGRVAREGVVVEGQARQPLIAPLLTRAVLTRTRSILIQGCLRLAPPPVVPILEYHASMLCDGGRNAAYAAGIRHAVASFATTHGRPPRVLDIGAGSGLLSFLAANCGAEQVIALERHAQLARLSAEDLSLCGVGRVVTVVAASSADLDSESCSADVVVSELFGSDPLSEGVLPTLHAARRLLRPGGTFVPAQLVRNILCLFYGSILYSSLFYCCFECESICVFDSRMRSTRRSSAWPPAAAARWPRRWGARVPPQPHPASRSRPSVRSRRAGSAPTCRTCAAGCCSATPRPSRWNWTEV